MSHPRIRVPGLVWSIDFEFATTCGTGRPVPHTFVAYNVKTGHEIRLEGRKLRETKKVPFNVRCCVCIAYNFAAEGECFEVLGWEQPWWAIDPYAEHRMMFNGVGSKENPIHHSILDAMRHFDIEVDAGKEAYKHAMQERAGAGEPFTDEERRLITEYCSDDTKMLAKLYLAMLLEVDVYQALVRGRYMISIGQQHFRGIPVDKVAIERFQERREDLRREMITATPGAPEYYPDGRFCEALFMSHLASREVGWPHKRNKAGKLAPDLEKCIWGQVAALDADVAPLASLRSVLAKLEDFKVPIRSDGRVRPNFWPFATVTARNAPKSTEYPLLQAKWARGFLLAPEGKALTQLDFKAQEVYIAAASQGTGTCKRT